MKNKAMIALLSILLVASFAFLAACSPAGESVSQTKTTTAGAASTTGTNTTEATQPGDDETGFPNYPLDGSVTLTYASGVSGHVTAVSTWQETPFWQEWQDQTGVNLELMEITDFSLLLASGDYPDIITSGSWGSYSGGIIKAIEDEIVLPITDYMDTLAVDYKGRLLSNEEWLKGAKTPDGQFTGFYHLRSNDPGVSNSYGMVIRNDWLTWDLKCPKQRTTLWLPCKPLKRISRLPTLSASRSGS